MTKSRSVALTVIANLIAPPSGHLYLGMFKRGFVILITGLLMTIALGWLGAAKSLWSFYLAQSFFILAIVALIIDGAIQARKCKAYQLKKYNRWYLYVGLIVIIIFIFNVLLTYRPYVFGFDSYRNASRNMAPTLMPDDLLVTDARGYILGNNLSRGQIIAFKFPMNPRVTYIKRIIGLAGDKVEIKGGIVHINGEAVPEPYIPKESKIKPVSRTMKEMTVPPETLFVLGDNRDMSNDSRFWGVVPLSNVQGVITAIWYSPDKSRIKTMLVKTNP